MKKSHKITLITIVKAQLTYTNMEKIIVNHSDGNKGIFNYDCLYMRLYYNHVQIYLTLYQFK